MNEIKNSLLSVFLILCTVFSIFTTLPVAIGQVVSSDNIYSAEKLKYKKSIANLNLSSYSATCTTEENNDGNKNMWYNGSDQDDYNIHGLITSRANKLAGNVIPENYLDLVQQFSQRCDINWRASGTNACAAFHAAGNYIASLKYLNIYAKEIAKHKDGDDIVADSNYADVVARSEFSDDLLNNTTFAQLSNMMKTIIQENYQVSDSSQTEGERCKYITIGCTMHLLGDIYAHKLVVPLKAIKVDKAHFDVNTMFNPDHFCTSDNITCSNGKTWAEFKADVSAGKVYFSYIKNYVKSGMKTGLYEDSPEFYPERFYESIYSATCYLTHFDEDFNLNILSPVGSLKMYNYYAYHLAVEATNDDTTTSIIPTSISLDKHSFSASSLKSFMLTATVSPGYQDNYNVIWTSTNSNVATVNTEGKVVVKGFGTCNIIASLRNNPSVSDACTITVTKPKTEFSYTVLKDGTLQIDGYNWDSATINIPEKYKGKKVTAINSLNSFSNGFKNATKIVIPSTVTTINTPYCDELDSLKTISVNKNNKYYSTKNGVLFNKKQTVLYAYPVKKSATTYVVPSTVKTISTRAFSRSALETVIMQSGLTKIKKCAFYFNTHLSSVKLPDTLTYIGKEVFCSTALMEINIPSSVSVIGLYAIGYWSAGGSSMHQTFTTYTIYGTNYSCAYWYAKTNSINFKKV